MQSRKLRCSRGPRGQILFVAGSYLRRKISMSEASRRPIHPLLPIQPLVPSKRSEGPAEAVDTVVEWCAQGPPAARVADVRREHGQLTAARSFEIR